MAKLLQAVTGFASSARGSKVVIGFWLVVVVVLSLLAPSAKMFAINSNASDLPSYVPSEQARAILEKHFPTDGGLSALLVFHKDQPIGEADRKKIAEFSSWLTNNKPDGVAQSVPLQDMPTTGWSQFLSQDGTTLLLPVGLAKQLDSHGVNAVVKQLDAQAEKMLPPTFRFAITGPAGIASDAIAVFQHADVWLMLGSVVLILVLLILLYRSPILAVVPLVIAGVLYEVADHLLGIAGKNGWFVVESQALSIMIILLFAVLTDYCLFVFSRYREELGRTHSQYEAMRETMVHIGESIFFSSSIILVSVLTLGVAFYKPYQHFAAVFGVALLVVLLGGLTLLPATFAVIGRKAFWPFVPKLGETAGKVTGWWSKMGRLVTQKPRLIVSLLSLVLVGSSLLMFNLTFSYNLLKSFPTTSESRVGFEIMQAHFPQGSLAPVNVLLGSSHEIQPDAALLKSLDHLENDLQHIAGIQSVTPQLSTGDQPGVLPTGVLSVDKQALKFQLVLADDPFAPTAMHTVETLRQQTPQLLQASGLDAAQFSLHYSGQTSAQLDTRDVNKRDTASVMILVTMLITVLLMFQSRSLIAPLYMML
ncbi:MAG: MMPL family transporter, partial [Tumebacillaceae bacterium]